MAPFPEVISQLPRGRLITMVPLWKKEHFVLTGMILTLDTELLSLHATLLPKLPSVDLTECLIRHHGVPHSTASDQGTRLPAYKVQPWTRVYEIRCFFPCSPPPWNSWFGRPVVEQPFEDLGGGGASKVAIHFRAGARFSRRLHVL